MMRSLQNLSHEKLLTCDMGELVPIMRTDVNPGEIWRQDTSLLVRTQPLLAPIMHKVDASIHHFFVPYRTIWEDFENFINGGEDGLQTPVFPTVTLDGTINAVGSLADHLGLPPEPTSLAVSALPFRAYAAIFNDWYRDEQLQTELTVDLTSGSDTTTNTDLQFGGWAKDYFTSSRPSPQLGSEVSIPLTGDAPVVGIGKENQAYGRGNVPVYETDGSGTVTYTNASEIDSGSINTKALIEQDPNNIGFPNIRADLSDVSAVDINALRTASALQRFKEKMNRRGARYVEYLQSMFGVSPQDARLQNPEYLGGGKVTIQFSEVLQTAEGTDPVGELRGHGIAAGKSNRYKFFVPEHGTIVSLLCVRPKTVYAQGVNRDWNRRSPYDFLIPDFANLGDQEVLNKEVYAAHTTPDGTFGYTPRYDEYRYIPNSISGEFRNTLDYWHMARLFASDPALNETFVKSNPTDRVYATDADQLQIRAIHRIKAKRPLPKRANPKLM
jgi:hypothetical protein